MSRDFAKTVLPTLLQENRFRSEQASKRKATEKRETEKQLIMEFGSAVQSLEATARTEEEFVSGYAEIKSDFANRGLTPEALELGRGLLKDHISGLRTREDRARTSLLGERSDIAEAQKQTSLKALAQIGRLKGQPALLDDAGRGPGAAREDLISLLDYPGQQELVKTERAGKTFDLSQKVKEAQLKKSTTPTFTKRTLFKDDGSSIDVKSQAEYDDAIKKDFSRVKPGKAGKTKASKAKIKGDLAIKRADRILKQYKGFTDEIGDDITPYQAMKSKADEGDAQAKSDLIKYEKFAKDAEGFYDKFNKIGGGLKIEIPNFRLERTGKKKERQPLESFLE